MKQACSFILFAILTSGAILTATPKQESGVVLFETKTPPQDLNLKYGKKAMEEKLYKNAQRYFSNYLQEEAKSPENKAEGTAMLGKAYLQDNQSQKALDVINAFLAGQEALPPGPIRNSLYLTGSQACLQAKDYTTALDFLKALLALPKGESEVSTAEMLDKITNALSSPAEELGVSRSEIIDALAAVWNATGEWDATQQLLEREIKNVVTPEDFNKLTWRRLEAALSQEKWQDAREFIRQLSATHTDNAEEVQPNQEDTDLRLTSILCDIGEGEIDAALDKLKAPKDNTGKKLAESVPNNQDQKWWYVLSKLANACQQKGKQADAAELFKKVKTVAMTKEQKNSAAASQAEALIAIGQLGEAKDVLKQLHDDLPNDFRVKMRLGEVLRDIGKSQSDHGEFRNASALFLEVAQKGDSLEKSQRYNAAFAAAECFDDQGLHVPKARDSYLLAVTLTDSPNEKAAAERFAAEQLEKAENKDSAIEQYIKIAERYGDTVPEAAAARLEAGRLLGTQGKAEKAIEQYNFFLKTDPPKNSRLRWQAEIGIGQAIADAQKGSDLLLEVASECTEDEQMSRGALRDSFNRAMELPGDSALEQARKVLDGYQKLYPGESEQDKDFLRDLSYRLVIRALKNENKDAFELGTTFLDAYPNDRKAPEVALRLGDAYANQAYRSRQASQDNGTNTASIDDPTKNAIAFYHKVADFPNISSDLKRLALYEEAVLVSELKTVPHTKTVIDQDGNQTLNETVDSGLEYSLDLINKVKETTPVADIIELRALFLEGDILTRQGKTEAALKTYETALKAAESQEPYLKMALLGRMAELYYSTKRYKEARETAMKVINNQPPPDQALKGRALLICARAYKETGEVSKAIECYIPIRDNYESTLRNTPEDATSPNVYVNAIRELLAIYESAENQPDANLARSIRGTYMKLQQAGHNLPPLPPPVDPRSNSEKR